MLLKTHTGTAGHDTHTMSRRGGDSAVPGRASEFATYMTNKVAKLREQHDQYAATAAAGAGTAGTEAGGVFAGVCIHVNGRTMPSAAVSFCVWVAVCVCVRVCCVCVFAVCARSANVWRREGVARGRTLPRPR